MFDHDFCDRCGKLMNAYVHGKLGDPLAAVPEARALRYCFDILRSMILEQRNHVGQWRCMAQERENLCVLMSTIISYRNRNFSVILAPQMSWKRLWLRA